LNTDLPYELHIFRTGHNPPGLMGAKDCNAAGTNGLTCLPKHGGALDNNFLVTHQIHQEDLCGRALFNKRVLNTNLSTETVLRLGDRLPPLAR
jgi:hypothetical protein